MSSSSTQQQQHQDLEPPSYSFANESAPATNVGLSGIYSQSGFDLLGILSRIVNRPNPAIAIGNVDFSCSFTVTDPRQYDNPIVYASETFSSYKKNGEPFINLVTLIPLYYKDTNIVEYYVGFQVDLVEQPQAILNRCKEGSYMVDYKIADQIVQRDDPKEMKSAYSDYSSMVAPPAPSATTVEPATETIDHFISKFLETSDFVHILSLRARFLYVSPASCKKLLEYDSPNELIGHHLHEFVHPADLVSVMRELRTSRAGDGINFLCRFRRNHSGYVYMEVNGHIFEGSNVSRKCFILTGREVHVCMLPVVPMAPTDKDSWVKLSKEGIILFITSSCRELFGLDNNAMFGTGILQHIHPEDRIAYQNVLWHVGDALSFGQCSVRILVKTSEGDAYAQCLAQFFPDRDTPTRHIFCRFKISAGVPWDVPIDFSVNMFDIMRETRATSLHYELNQLRMKNKRLREELESMTAPISKKKLKGKQ
ncbi:blue light receptor [Chytridiales sp. JEL 0842]|nr:blue light receptor [Chytridiales sp. JEL 0842]